MADKNYNLRTRDLYHPLYSTYQLDYVRPNVWEIVIGGTTMDQLIQVSQSTNAEETWNVTNTYESEGHQTLAAFGAQTTGGLSLYCSKFQLNLPKSNVISVPWISGVTKLAGRNNEGFSITAEFYAGLGSNDFQNIGENSSSSYLGSTEITDDVLRLLYGWRNLCFDARTGQIGLAPNYKKPASVFLYDPSGVKVLYEFTVHGLWPSEIGNIELDISGDDIIKLSVTFQADYVYMEDESYVTDINFNPDTLTQAGNTSIDLLYYDAADEA